MSDSKDSISEDLSAIRNQIDEVDVQVSNVN